MTLFQAVLCGLACWLITASPLTGGMFSQSIVTKPLTAAFFCGLIMGDMKTAMAIGIPIQAMYLGQMAIGGVSTMPSCSISLYFIIPLCIATHTDAEYAITLAVPFGVVEQFLTQLKFQLDLIPVHMMQKYANEGNPRMVNISINLGWVIQGAIYFFVPFIACIAGQDAMVALVNAMPSWLTGILGVFTSLCPLIGFSLLLNALVTKPIQLVYVLFGFTLAKVAGFSIIVVTAIAAAIAVMFFELSGTGGGNTHEEEEEF